MNIETAVPNAYSLATAHGLRELWYLRGRVTIKVFGEQTDYRFSQIETESPAGAQAPMHVHHREDETLLVLEGDVTVFVGRQRFDLSAGGFTFLPRGIAHAYYVRSASARWLVTLSPAGFERFFVEVGRPIEPGMPRPEPMVPDPADFARRLLCTMLNSSVRPHHQAGPSLPRVVPPSSRTHSLARANLVVFSQRLASEARSPRWRQSMTSLNRP